MVAKWHTAGRMCDLITTNTTPLRMRRGLLRKGLAMVEDIVGCLIAVAFGVAVAFQIGGEG